MRKVNTSGQAKFYFQAVFKNFIHHLIILQIIENRLFYIKKKVEHFPHPIQFIRAFIFVLIRWEQFRPNHPQFLYVLDLVGTLFELNPAVRIFILQRLNCILNSHFFVWRNYLSEFKLLELLSKYLLPFRIV